MNANYTGRDNLAAMRAAPRYNAAVLAQLLATVGAGRRLDFGAGDGLFAELVAAHGAPPVCLEPDEALAARLVAGGFETHRALATVAGTFDGVYSINVLEHIADDTGTLRAIADQTAPGGRLFVFVPAWPLLYGSMDRRVGHVRRYRKRELVDKLEASGWTVDHVRYFDSIGFFSALAYRFLGPEHGDLSSASLATYDRWVFPLSAVADRLLSCCLGKNLMVRAHRQP